MVDVDQALVLRSWRRLFDNVYRQRTAPVYGRSDGWNSLITGVEFDASELRCWADETAELVLEGEPSSILDIGCGGGLVAHRLIAAVDQYCGVDGSISAVRRLKERHGASGGVLLAVVDAGGIGALRGLFDAVVLNSVVQFFPDERFLRRALTDAHHKVRPSGRLVIGDVRHPARAERLYAEAAARDRSGEGRAEGHGHPRSPEWFAIRDPELLVPPEAIVELAASWDGDWWTEVRVKSTLGPEELWAYRFDVVVHAPGDARRACDLADSPRVDASRVPLADIPGVLADASVAVVVENAVDAVTKPGDGTGAGRTVRDLLDDMARAHGRRLVLTCGHDGTSLAAVFLAPGDERAVVRWGDIGR